MIEFNRVTPLARVDPHRRGETSAHGNAFYKLFILGNPKACTPVLLPAASIAIELPLKYWSREDAHKKTWGRPVRFLHPPNSSTIDMTRDMR
jgi:hypothetical protein